MHDNDCTAELTIMSKRGLIMDTQHAWLSHYMHLVSYALSNKLIYIGLCMNTMAVEV